MNDMERLAHILKHQKLLVAITVASIIFSFWLMFHTFQYDTKLHEFHMATTVWSDFGSQIPLVRSFSMGDNLYKFFTGKPVEHPLFPGEPIRYHFLFYMVVGIMERIGFPIDWAMNIPSIVGFSLLLVMIYVVSYKLFEKPLTSLLSVLFFLCNGSLSFLSYFKKAGGFSLQAIQDIPHTLHFPSFGPWDGGYVSAFWNLNIYTNQRHLSLSFALALIILYLILEPFTHGKMRHTETHYGIILGILIGVLLFLNQAVCAIGILFIGYTFIFSKPLRKNILIAGLVTIPFLLLLSRITHIPSSLSYHPGYLISPPLTIFSFLTFWFYNLGLYIFLIPVSLFFVPKKAKLLLGALVLLFIIPNVIQFSPDMINNHKFFNFFFIVGAMYGALVVSKLFSIKKVGIYLGLLACVLVTLSGIIDLFVIINDTRGTLPDVGTNATATYIATYTKPSDIILNSTWFYHPATLAGRSIFSGYPYFTWSYGYDKETRELAQKAIYQSPTKEDACALLLQNHIDYIELNEHPETFLMPNKQLFDSQFVVRFSSAKENTKLYDVQATCLN